MSLSKDSTAVTRGGSRSSNTPTTYSHTTIQPLGSLSAPFKYIFIGIDWGMSKFVVTIWGPEQQYVRLVNKSSIMPGHTSGRPYELPAYGCYDTITGKFIYGTEMLRLYDGEGGEAYKSPKRYIKIENPKCLLDEHSPKMRVIGNEEEMASLNRQINKLIALGVITDRLQPVRDLLEAVYSCTKTYLEGSSGPINKDHVRLSASIPPGAASVDKRLTSKLLTTAAKVVGLLPHDKFSTVFITNEAIASATAILRHELLPPSACVAVIDFGKSTVDIVILVLQHYNGGELIKAEAQLVIPRSCTSGSSAIDRSFRNAVYNDLSTQRDAIEQGATTLAGVIDGVLMPLFVDKLKLGVSRNCASLHRQVKISGLKRDPRHRIHIDGWYTIDWTTINEAFEAASKEHVAFIKDAIEEAEVGNKARVSLLLASGGFSENPWVKDDLSKLRDDLNKDRTMALETRYLQESPYGPGTICALGALYQVTHQGEPQPTKSSSTYFYDYGVPLDSDLDDPKHAYIKANQSTLRQEMQKGIKVYGNMLKPMLFRGTIYSPDYVGVDIPVEYYFGSSGPCIVKVKVFVNDYFDGFTENVLDHDHEQHALTVLDGEYEFTVTEQVKKYGTICSMRAASKSFAKKRYRRELQWLLIPSLKDGIFGCSLKINHPDAGDEPTIHGYLTDASPSMHHDPELRAPAAPPQAAEDLHDLDARHSLSSHMTSMNNGSRKSDIAISEVLLPPGHPPSPRSMTAAQPSRSPTPGRSKPRDGPIPAPTATAIYRRGRSSCKLLSPPLLPQGNAAILGTVPLTQPSRSPTHRPLRPRNVFGVAQAYKFDPENSTTLEPRSTAAPSVASQTIENPIQPPPSCLQKSPSHLPTPVATEMEMHNNSDISYTPRRSRKPHAMVPCTGRLLSKRIVDEHQSLHDDHSTHIQQLGKRARNEAVEVEKGGPVRGGGNVRKRSGRGRPPYA